MVPGVVPVALLVARTDTQAVLVDGLLVYQQVRLRPGRPAPPRPTATTNLTRASGTSSWRSASPTAAALTTARPLAPPRRDQPPDPPFLYQSVIGPDGGHLWLWGLPPPGPLTFACQWPAGQIPPSQAELDAGLVLAAATRARTLWPDPSPP